MDSETYLLPKHAFLSGRAFKFWDFSGLLSDSWESFRPTELVEYFNRGYGIFRKRLKEFGRLNRELSYEGERELKFMLDSLIHAKNAIHQPAKNRF